MDCSVGLTQKGGAPFRQALNKLDPSTCWIDFEVTPLGVVLLRCIFCSLSYVIFIVCNNCIVI